MPKSLAQKTIDDFGRQHRAYSKSDGYYTSTNILDDVVGPLMEIGSFNGLDILDLGSGTGRWLRIFHSLGAKSITAVEPSEAIEVAKKNSAGLDNITYLNVTGDQIPDGQFDIFYSYGVVHHIPEPDPVIKRAFEVLKPGGRIVLWLYGRENNGLYLAFMHTLRVITVPLPNRGLDWISSAMVPMVRAYSHVSKYLPLPLRGYMREFVDKIDNYTLKHVIFDQLDPHYAKYYSREEAKELVEKAGFTDVQLYHREGYSWTIMAFKPQQV